LIASANRCAARHPSRVLVDHERQFELGLLRACNWRREYLRRRRAPRREMICAVSCRSAEKCRKIFFANLFLVSTIESLFATGLAVGLAGTAPAEQAVRRHA
jgi:hypothetical protein